MIRNINGYTEKRRISVEQLRSLCIMNGWYSRGTCGQYDRLFQRACSKDNLTTEDIEDIVADIIEHSSEESFQDYEFEDVMFAVISRTHTTVQKD